MLNVMTNSEIDLQEEEARQAAIDAQDGSPGVIEIVSYVQKCWQAAKTAKQPIETIMLQNLRMKNGEYDPAKLTSIREQGGSEIFMMLPEEKCGAAEAWIEDILLPAGAEPFGAESTPVPDLSPAEIAEIKQQIQQEAYQYAIQAGGNLPSMEAYIARAQELLQGAEARMIKQAKESADTAEQDIKDKAKDAEWRKALQEAIPDLVLYPCGFIKGPITRMKKEFAWDEQGRPIVKTEKAIEFESPSPWDIYPSPTSKDIGDGFIIERMQFTRADLYSLIGVDGYDRDAINGALEQFGSGGTKNWLSLSNDTTRAQLEGRQHEDWDPEGKIDALQFWGNIQGLALLEYGIPRESIDDPFGEYFCEVVLIGSFVIKAEINGDPLGRPPYFKAGFRKKKGSFWQVSMMELMKDCVDVCNASARNLVNNMAIASGPQVGVDTDKLPPGEEIEKMQPWKIWQFKMGNLQTAQHPIWFFQPSALINELIAVYDKFSIEADNKTGIPKYSYGGNAEHAAGALKTASGMSMMMSNASKSIKKVVGNIDDGLIQPSIQRLMEWMMLYDPTPALMSGDIKIRAKGSSSLIAKEQQQLRRNEFLQIALHPTITQIVGVEGVAEILRKILHGLDIDSEDVVPTKEELVRKLQVQQQAMMEQQAQIQGPATGRGVNHAGQVAGGADARTM